MSSSAIATSPKDTNDDSSSSNKLSSIGHGKDMSAFVPALTEISNLSDSIYSSVAARARAMLMQYRTPSVAQVSYINIHTQTTIIIAITHFVRSGLTNLQLATLFSVCTCCCGDTLSCILCLCLL
jgi:hypothetical protein